MGIIKILDIAARTGETPEGVIGYVERYIIQGLSRKDAILAADALLSAAAKRRERATRVWFC